MRSRTGALACFFIWVAGNFREGLARAALSHGCAALHKFATELHQARLRREAIRRRMRPIALPWRVRQQQLVVADVGRDLIDIAMLAEQQDVLVQAARDANFVDDVRIQSGQIPDNHATTADDRQHEIDVGLARQTAHIR